MERTKQQSRQIAIAFIISLAFLLFLPNFMPSWKLTFFAPFLISLYYKRPLEDCLYWSIGCGFILDLLSGYDHLGLHALSYTITTTLLYPQRKSFFEDSVSTLPVMSALFAILSTIILAFSLSIFEKPLEITWGWIFSDLIIMPAFDALYAYLFFTLPGFVMPKSTKREYFI